MIGGRPVVRAERVIFSGGGGDWPVLGVGDSNWNDESHTYQNHHPMPDRQKDLYATVSLHFQPYSQLLSAFS